MTLGGRGLRPAIWPHRGDACDPVAIENLQDCPLDRLVHGFDPYSATRGIVTRAGRAALMQVKRPRRDCRALRRLESPLDPASVRNGVDLPRLHPADKPT